MVDTISITHGPGTGRGATRKRRNRKKKSAEPTCRLCGVKFVDQPSLQQHISAKHNKGPVREAVMQPRAKAVKKKPSGPRALQGMGGADTRLIESFLGRGGSGAQWAFKALDPCAEQEEGGWQIPDKTATSTVALEGRTDTTISSLTGPEILWDCLIVSVPLPEAPIWVFRKTSGTPNWDPQPLIIYAPSVVYGGTTGAGPTFPLTSTPTLGNYGEGFRTSYKGFSVVFDAADLTNQGRVFAGQIRSPLTRETTGVVVGEVTEEWPVLLLDKIPNDQTALLSACSEMVRGKAREGIYVPQRFNQPIHAFTPTSWDTMQAGDTAPVNKVLPRVQFNFVNDSGARVYPLPTPLHTTQTSANTVCVSGEDNTQMGVALFTGMHGSTNLDLKMRIGVEVQAAPGGPWSAFSRATPMLDEKAIRDVAIITEELNVAYPERYNSWGALLPVIGQAVSSLLNWGVSKVTNWATNRYAARSARQPAALDIYSPD